MTVSKGVLPQRKIDATRIAANRLDRRTRLLIRTYQLLDGLALVADLGEANVLLWDIKTEMMKR